MRSGSWESLAISTKMQTNVGCEISTRMAWEQFHGAVYGQVRDRSPGLRVWSLLALQLEEEIEHGLE